MSKRNMVNVGGIVDPFSGLQRGLSGIAQTFGAQADAEAKEKARLDNLALDRAAAEESKRRFEQNRSDTLNRNDILDQRYKDEQKILKAERDRVAKERAKTKKDETVFSGITTDITLDDLGYDSREKVTAFTNQANNTIADLEAKTNKLLEERSYIDKNGKFSEAGQEEYGRRLEVYSRNLPLNEAIQKAKNEVAQIQETALASNFDKEAKNSIEAIRKGTEQATRDILNNPTLEEFTRSASRQLAAGGYSNPNSAATLNAISTLGGSRGLRKEATIRAGLSSAAEEAYNVQKDRVNALHKYYTATKNDKNKNKSSTYKGVDDKTWKDYIGDLDAIGNSDYTAANRLLGTLVKSPRLKGINPGIIKEAIMLTETNVFFDRETLDATDTESLKEITDLAIALNSGNVKGSDVAVKKSDYEIKVPNARTFEQQMASRFNPKFNVKGVPSKQVLEIEDIQALRKKAANAQIAKDRDYRQFYFDFANNAPSPLAFNQPGSSVEQENARLNKILNTDFTEGVQYRRPEDVGRKLLLTSPEPTEAFKEGQRLNSIVQDYKDVEENLNSVNATLSSLRPGAEKEALLKYTLPQLQRQRDTLRAKLLSGAR